MTRRHWYGCAFGLLAISATACGDGGTTATTSTSGAGGSDTTTSTGGDTTSNTGTGGMGTGGSGTGGSGTGGTGTGGMGTGGSGGSAGALFAPPASYVVGGMNAGSAWTIAGGDVNGDGVLDLATSHLPGPPFSGTSVLLGKGDGTFQPKVFSEGTFFMTNALALADLDGDKKAELLASQTDGMGHVVVLDIAADGKVPAWESGTQLSVPGMPQELIARDLDGDMDVDLAVPSPGSGLWVFLNQGKGTFGPGVNYPAGTANAVAAADFDQNGKLDLVVADKANVRVFPGKGDGTYEASTTYAAGTTPIAVATADFNGDGKPDIAAANSASDDMSVLLNKGDGTFEAAKSYASLKEPASIGAADFDGDGKADVAVLNRVSHDISVFVNKGDGTFADAVKLVVGGNPHGLVVADFNGDKKPDLATSSDLDSDVAVLLNVAP